jgi:hypothetical protein
VKTLKASLLASVIGTAAWLLGVTGKIWPSHPMWAVFFVTIGAMVLLLYVLPEPEKR